jgi:hypothetical protein
VLEGSVRHAKDTLRVTAQLINALDNTHLWAERYDRPASDIFAAEIDPTYAPAFGWQSYACTQLRNTPGTAEYLAQENLVRGEALADQAIALNGTFAAGCSRLAVYWKEPRDRERMCEGLRKAGIPEGAPK